MEWPGCVLICGAVLVPGVDGCASGLVWSGLSLLHQSLPFRVSLFTSLSDLHAR